MLSKHVNIFLLKALYKQHFGNINTKIVICHLSYKFIMEQYIMKNYLIYTKRVIVLLIGVLASIFIADFSNIGTAVYAQEENVTIEKVTVGTYYLNGKLRLNHKEKVRHESIKDPATGKETSSIHTQYAPNGNIRFTKEYQYDINTGNKTNLSIKAYFEDGKIMQTNEYSFDPTTDSMTSQIQTVYQSNGEISYIKEFRYASGWEMPISSFDTDYYNGKIFAKTEDYWDINTHNKTHSISEMYDNENGNVKFRTEEYWDVNTENMVRYIHRKYSKDGSIESEEEYTYDSETGEKIDK